MERRAIHDEYNTNWAELEVYSREYCEECDPRVQRIPCCAGYQQHD